MRSIAFLIVTVAVILATIVIFRRRRNAPMIHGFREWLRDPRLFWRDVAKSNARQNAPLPRRVTDRHIRQWVSDLLDPRGDREAQSRLTQVGRPALPALIEALRDARFRNAPQPGLHFLAKSPLERALAVLESIAAPESADAIAPFLLSDNKEHRKEAAMTLGSIGAETCTKPAIAAIESDDERIRSHAFIGIRRAIQAGRATPGFLHGIFNALAGALEAPGHEYSSAPAEFMLQIDRARALLILLDERLLRSDNEKLAPILRALNAARVEIPADIACRLETALASCGEDAKRAGAYGQVIVAMAIGNLPGAVAKARAALDSPAKEIRQRGAESVAILHGVSDPITRIYDREKQRGWDRLSEPERYFASVWTLDADVNNGGFSQYFFNSYSDHCRDALQGLRAIGAPQAADLLGGAMALFGPAGPALDRIARQQELSRIVDQDPERFNEFDNAYYKGAEAIYVQLMLYAAKHASHFGGRPESEVIT